MLRVEDRGDKPGWGYIVFFSSLIRPKNQTCIILKLFMVTDAAKDKMNHRALLPSRGCRLCVANAVTITESLCWHHNCHTCATGMQVFSQLSQWTHLQIYPILSHLSTNLSWYLALTLKRLCCCRLSGRSKLSTWRSFSLRITFFSYV